MLIEDAANQRRYACSASINLEQQSRQSVNFAAQFQTLCTSCKQSAWLPGPLLVAVPQVEHLQQLTAALRADQMQVQSGQSQVLKWNFLAGCQHHCLQLPETADSDNLCLIAGTGQVQP